jgi:hypothetical protein
MAPTELARRVISPSANTPVPGGEPGGHADAKAAADHGGPLGDLHVLGLGCAGAEVAVKVVDDDGGGAVEDAELAGGGLGDEAGETAFDAGQEEPGGDGGRRRA